MKNSILVSCVLFMSVVFFTACGSDSKKNPIEPEAPTEVEPYTFFNATTPIIVTKSSEVNSTISGNNFSISVQLLKHGLVAAGVSIQMKPFNFKYGSIETSVVDTDDNGVVEFIYVAPTGSDYDVIQGQNFIIEAILLASENEESTTTSDDSPPRVLLVQPFVLQFK